MARAAAHVSSRASLSSSSLVAVAEHYRVLARKGYRYGPAFRAMTAAWRTEGRISHTENSVKTSA
ncbi:hypothetical protein BS329_39310 [Amycolatopsis coloradensis]|uniref:Polyketide synthase dehydratase domain-containing protein n=1 Tax=Amycolatopsis coloradensis TaxID=76021 RepID=A0A1R0KEA7_9PSEU|nr:hypothetical protein BS329_39310 [Amycolatopsis coloradensis]